MGAGVVRVPPRDLDCPKGLKSITSLNLDRPSSYENLKKGSFLAGLFQVPDCGLTHRYSIGKSMLSVLRNLLVD